MCFVAGMETINIILWDSLKSDVFVRGISDASFESTGVTHEQSNDAIYKRIK